MKVTVYQIDKVSRLIRRSVRCDDKKQAQTVIKQLKDREVAPHLEHYRYAIERGHN